MTNPITFLKEARTELKKISWPGRRQTIRLTAVVIGVSLAVAFFVGIVDYVFAKLISLVI